MLDAHLALVFKYMFYIYRHQFLEGKHIGTWTHQKQKGWAFYLAGAFSTPFASRFRESLKVSNSPLEEPELHLDASPTLDAKLKLKPRRRLEQLPDDKV